MTFFESLLALLAAAILLLQIARRAGLPYPGMLAAAGVAVAMIPGTPTIPIDPQLALALFIAPVLVDAGYDYPLATVRRLALPLITYAVLAVAVTTGAVGALVHFGWGVPLAAALALGAIVAPPDAAAATAVLSNLPVDRRVDAVLKGESLFNDATALLLFSAAVTIQSSGGLDGKTVGEIAIAAPGGILFGIAYGLLSRKLQPFVENTVGGTLLQFVHAFTTWIIAEHLHLSAVLATVASAMTIASQTDVTESPRMRVHSFAVWTTVVFLLNVIAFLLMGMQARTIVQSMSRAELIDAAWMALQVVGVVIVVRLAIAMIYHLYALARHQRGGEEPVTTGEAILVGWAGMRGLVTLATAFALPANFPQRDQLVLVAFAVVLATLAIQGITLAPLIRWLGANREADAQGELERARRSLAEAALARLADEPGHEAADLRRVYGNLRSADDDRDHSWRVDRHHGLAIAAVMAQRKRLEELRERHEIGPDRFLELQEALDWKQLSMTNDEARRIDES